MTTSLNTRQQALNVPARIADNVHRCSKRRASFVSRGVRFLGADAAQRFRSLRLSFSMQ